MPLAPVDVRVERDREIPPLALESIAHVHLRCCDRLTARIEHVNAVLTGQMQPPLHIHDERRAPEPVDNVCASVRHGVHAGAGQPNDARTVDLHVERLIDVAGRWRETKADEPPGTPAERLRYERGPDRVWRQPARPSGVHRIVQLERRPRVVTDIHVDREPCPWTEWRQLERVPLESIALAVYLERHLARQTRHRRREVLLN